MRVPVYFEDASLIDDVRAVPRCYQHMRDWVFSLSDKRGKVNIQTYGNLGWRNSTFSSRPVQR